MFPGGCLGAFVEASRLLALFFLVTNLKELSELLARGLDLLGLQSGLDHIEGVGDEAREAAGDSGAEEVPEVRVSLVPGSEVSLEVLIHAHYSRGEGDVHHHCHGVGPEQGRDAFLLHDGPNALARCEVRAQLQSLLNH